MKPLLRSLQPQDAPDLVGLWCSHGNLLNALPLSRARAQVELILFWPQILSTSWCRCHTTNNTVHRRAVSWSLGNARQQFTFSSGM